VAKEHPDQQPLPGAEDVKNPKIHRLAQAYARARDERMEYTETEKKAHNRLLDGMIAEGLESYKYGSLTVTIDQKKKCVVKQESAVGTAKDDGGSDES
jgi:hypothetical protein